MIKQQPFILANNKLRVKSGEDNIAEEDNILQYKGIFYNEDAEQKFYEHGAHFKFQDLCKRLQLIAQSRDKENMEINANKNHSRNKTNHIIPGASMEDKKKVCTINFDMLPKSKYSNLLPKENTLHNNKHQFQTFQQEEVGNTQSVMKDSFKFSPSLQNNAVIQKSIVNTNKLSFDIKASVNNYFTNK
jgi:isochorismate synthase EntC